MVDEAAKITINDTVKLLIAVQFIDIRLGSVHRAENTNELPMLLIEVQIGLYLSKYDIIRNEDIYA